MENGIIAKTERFDKDALLSLLSHNGVSALDKKNLKAYSKKRFDGNKVQIQYNYGKEWRKLKMGRISPDPYLGLCVFPSDIRACLAQKYYWDIDIINAQPVILSQIATQLGVECPALNEYVSNREAILKEISTTHNIDRKDAKDICIAVLFGGIRTQHRILIDMSQELIMLSSKVVERFPEISANTIKLKKPNPLASSLAIYIQNEYIQFVSNRLAQQLNTPKIYPNARNPFSFMDMICMEGKTNFFENKVSEYAFTKERIPENFSLTEDF